MTLDSGQAQITALHVPGDFVDLHGFLLHPLDHSVTALSACVITTVRHDDLARLIVAFPDLQHGLWFLTVVDAALHRQWLTVVGRRSALSGMAHLLCELYLRLRDVGLAGDGRFAWPMTQSKIADVLCLSAVHVNRVAQELRRRDLVNWRGPEVEILHWDRLSALGQFDPTYLQLRSPE